MAYLVVLDEQHFRYDNKYVWITAAGDVAEQYSKHFPVPGEPKTAGTKPIEVLQRPYGKVAGAICYDDDCPKLAREHSLLGAELVVVPSSEWLGIQALSCTNGKNESDIGGDFRYYARFDGQPQWLMTIKEGSCRVLIILKMNV